MALSPNLVCNSPTVSGQEDFSHAVARIERLGKHLFGVSACVVYLHTEKELLVASEAHQFCAQLPLTDDLQVVPEKSSPFQAALGKFDNVEVRFYALQPLRDSTGKIVGRMALIHERSRMFTAGDKDCLVDLVALFERELHFRTSSLSAHPDVTLPS
ncbi:MAG: GAF domain-containing protein [Pseudomonadota bacterium]